MTRVLVTGASGFIGRHAIRHLLDAGFEVHTLSRHSPPEEFSTFHRHVDMFDTAAVREAFEAIRPSHLLHLAWFVSPGAFWSSTENLRWVQASIDLLRIFVESGGSRSVMAGTCAEYDWTGDGVCVESKTSIRPQTVYGACKAALSLIHEQYSRQTGGSFAWGRVFHLYGPHEAPSRLVPSIIRSLLNNEPAKCTHGRQIRDFMHVDDVARAFVAVLASDVQGPVNIASGTPLTIAEVATVIAERVGRWDLLTLGAVPVSASEPASLTASVSRLSALGFTPRYSIEKGLQDTIEWWRSRTATASEE